MNTTNMTCPSIIDIEASGFGPDSYPIEIGIVKSCGKRYCSLIKPAPQWTYWSENAEELHGISKETLAKYGRSPELVCRELNALLEGLDVFSDAWSHDQAWLATLYRVSGMVPSFNIRALEFILDEEHLTIWDQVKNAIQSSNNINRHRASSDAHLIQLTYLECIAEKASRPHSAASR